MTATAIQPPVAAPTEPEAAPAAPFAWDATPDVTAPAPPIFALIVSESGLGKTHLGCTFPGPVVCLDTEVRANLVLRKFKNTYWKKILSFDDVRRAIASVMAKHKVGGTILFDSASDLNSLAEAEVLDQIKDAGKKAHNTLHWGPVYERLGKMFGHLRSSGWNVVMTARLADEYVADAKTGRREASGFVRNKLVFQADFAVQIVMRGSERVGIVLKNGARKPGTYRVEMKDEELNYAGIVRAMEEEAAPIVEKVGGPSIVPAPGPALAPKIAPPVPCAVCSSLYHETSGHAKATKSVPADPLPVPATPSPSVPAPIVDRPTIAAIKNTTTTQGGLLAPIEAHNLDHAGSIPAPAPTPPAGPDSSGDKLERNIGSPLGGAQGAQAPTLPHGPGDTGHLHVHAAAPLVAERPAEAPVAQTGGGDVPTPVPAPVPAPIPAVDDGLLQIVDVLNQAFTERIAGPELERLGYAMTGAPVGGEGIEPGELCRIADRLIEGEKTANAALIVSAESALARGGWFPAWADEREIVDLIALVFAIGATPEQFWDRAAVNKWCAEPGRILRKHARVARAKLEAQRAAIEKARAKKVIQPAPAPAEPAPAEV